LPHGSYFRGEYVEFSVLVDQSVQDLKSFSVRFDTYDTPFYLTVPKSEGYFRQLPSINFQMTLPDVHGTGSISTSPGQYEFPEAYANLAFFGVERDPNAIVVNQLTGKIATLINFHYQVDSPGAINGPGELYRNGLFVRLDAPLEFGQSDEPHVTFTDAVDTSGKPVALIAKTLPTTYVYRLFGDINGDDKVDLADVSLILKAAVGVTPFTSDYENWYADVHPTSPDGKIMASGRFLGDGQITLADALTTLKVALGMKIGWWPDRL
jgi:hypothetical protein